MSRRLEDVARACLAVFLGAALYEALVALEVIAMGTVPGEGPPGSGVVLAAALLGSLTAAVACLARAHELPREPRLVWAALAPAGAVYLVARWYAFDPYYLPTLRRYADGGVSGWWIAVVAGAAIVAAVVSLRFPRAGAVWTSVVLLLTGFTVWALPLGK